MQDLTDKIWEDIIKSKYLHDIDFIKTIITSPKKNNKYVTIEKDGYTIHLTEDHRVKRTKDEPVFRTSMPVTVTPSMLTCVKKSIKSTVGSLILNYLYIEYALYGKLDYIQGMFDFGDIEKIIIPMINEDKLSIMDYKRAGKVVVFLRPIAAITIIPSTEKVDFKPEWLDKYKKEVKEKYIKKYGPDALKDPKVYLEYEKEIMDKYKDYLKDDPTYGITTDKKIVEQSLKKRFVAMGLLDTLDKNKLFSIIEESLKDGVPLDKEKFADIVNNIYNGSAERGIATKDSGYFEKILVKTMFPYVIDMDDCGTKKGYPFKITELNKEVMVGKYYINGSKSILITNDTVDSLIGKTVALRLPHNCKAGKSRFCKKCSGETLAKVESGMLLIAIGLGGEYLNFNLSKFHAVTYKLINLDIDDLF